MASRVDAPGSPALDAVLSAVAKTAARLCEARDALILLVERDHLRLVAHHGLLDTFPLGATYPLRPTGPLGHALIERRVIHIRDMARAVRTRYPDMAAIQRRSRSRTVLVAPMVRDGIPVGGIVIRRAQVRPFSARQIALLKTFADQAALAIENARLFTELQARNRNLTEALEQQTATGEVLRVISGSPTDVQPVFDTIVRSAVRLCDALFGTVLRLDGERIHLVSHHNLTPEGLQAYQDVYPMSISRDTVAGSAILDRRVTQVIDSQDETAVPWRSAAMARAVGFRSVLVVPMLRGGQPIGVINVARREPGSFSDRQIELLQTFADQAVIAIENVRLFTELQEKNRALTQAHAQVTEALEQQTATAEILQVISRSPTDVQPVLDAVARSATRLCETENVSVYLVEGPVMRRVAGHGTLHPAAVGETRPISRGSASGRAILDRQMVHIKDVEAARESEFPDIWPGALAQGVRTAIAVPLLREGTAIGAISAYRVEARSFSAANIALLQTFADQAVIAIENVRLFTELQARNRQLSDALEQQMATSQILRVISSAHTDAQPVFDTIVQSAVRLCHAAAAGVFRTEGGMLYEPANYGMSPETLAATRARYPRPLGMDTTPGIAILTRSVVQVPDTEDASAIEHVRQTGRFLGIRSMVTVPMLREGEAVGALVVTRRDPGRFSDAEVELLQTFADQAVIAIENVRLFTELDARNRDLAEALEQQTATAQILRIISSSPTDLQPVFDTIIRSAVQLCDAVFGGLHLFDGERIDLNSIFDSTIEGPPQELALLRERVFPFPAHRKSAIGRAVLDRSTVHVHDFHSDPEFDLPAVKQLARYRTVLAVPMLREDIPIGGISLWRDEVRPFTQKQIEVVRVFADQAVIAIENVRLFTELQARNRELTEALEQQTATANILRVISRSPTDVQPTFEAIVASAAGLCQAEIGSVFRFDGQLIHLAAHHGSDLGDVVRRVFPIPPGRGSVTARAILTRAATHVPDLARDPEFEHGALVASGVRSVLSVPMLRDGEPIGAITVSRQGVRPFSDVQLALLQTFADQAVIAVENVRLFTELQARTAQLTHSVEQLTALEEVGRALSSTLDVETVLHTIVSRASQLAGTDACSVFEYDETTEEFRLRATDNLAEEVVAVARRTPIRKGEGVQGRMAITRQPVQIPDIAAPDAYRGPLRDVLLRAGIRALLAVPLLREDHLVGALTVSKKTPGDFSREIVGLLQTFATQSALAIQNARLFREIEAKSRQLETASQHKSQFLANMSHELRTPLNAILGYTELIADRIYGEVPEKMQEVLERVGKSGRHLLGLINDILDLSKIEAGQLILTLADYSMADVVHSVAASVEALAAEKKLALAVTVDPDLPLAHGDQRRLTQVLLNLVGNALKFTDAGRVIVRAGQDDDTFQVSVTDTGPGIAEADWERIFEEFQQAETTTRHAKGGTGLGLAIARRIIAMHGGRLWVDSVLGEGSTFTFTVPIRMEQQVGVPRRRADA